MSVATESLYIYYFHFPLNIILLKPFTGENNLIKCNFEKHIFQKHEIYSRVRIVIIP